jgi:hypothetical protein
LTDKDREACGPFLKCVDEGLLDRERVGCAFFHSIQANKIMEELATSSKLISGGTLHYKWTLPLKWLCDNSSAPCPAKSASMRRGSSTT